MGNGVERKETTVQKHGFTLVEMLTVVAILVVAAALLVPQLGGIGDDAGSRATQETMRALRDACRGASDDPGYRGTMGTLPTVINDLFLKPSGALDYNPFTKKGFRPNGYMTPTGAVYTVDASHGFTSAYCTLNG